MNRPVKELLAAPGNCGGARTAGQIQYLVIHYTGNDGDKAAGNAAYFQSRTVGAGAHYFMDDTTVYRSVPDLRTAWAVGGGKYANADRTGGGTLYGLVTNANSISVELCDTVKNGVYQASEATLANAAGLCRELMARYGIPPERVCRHFDVTGKHCPSYMIGAAPWAAFKARLEEGRMDNTPADYAKDAVKWAVENGVLTGNAEGGLLLSRPVTRQQMAAVLHRFWKMDRP